MLSLVVIFFIIFFLYPSFPWNYILVEIWIKFRVGDKFTVRYEALKAEKEATSGKDIQKELEELKVRYKKLKVSSCFPFVEFGFR